MTTVQHSIRLSGTLDKVLRKLAEQQSVTVYAMLQRIVKSGLAAEGGSPAAGVADSEMIAEPASLSIRVAHIEHLLDRTLFTACAAYCYARSAAHGADESDAAVTAEIHAAYERQRRLAEERGQ